MTARGLDGARARTLAHISDLHIGRGAETERRALALCRRLAALQIDHVVVTGDVTHRGRHDELARFRQIFAPLIELGKVSVVPGNHDRIGEDAAALLMPEGARVTTQALPGLFVVRFDSTGPHNRSWMAGHGLLTEDDIAAIVAAASRAPQGALVALLLHHHVLPYPHDNGAEWFVSLLGSQAAEELPLGRALLEALRGCCDLVLHGHRHVPGSLVAFGDETRPLRLFNAGSSSALGHVRIFSHAGGRLLGMPRWTSSAAPPRLTCPREHLLAY